MKGFFRKRRTMRNAIPVSKQMVFFSNPSLKVRSFRLGPCWKKIKPVVAKKSESEYGDILIALFGIFEKLSGLWRKAQNHRFFNRIFWYKNMASDWDLNERNEPLIRRKVSCNIKEIQNLHFLVFSQCGDHRMIWSSLKILGVKIYFSTLEKLGQWRKLIYKNWKKVEYLHP